MVTTQRHMGTVRMITTNSPELTSGHFDVTFGEYEKVVHAGVYLQQSLLDDYVLATATSISGNVVTVTIKKIDVTDDASPAPWQNAVDANVNGEDVVVVADCI